MKMKRNSSMFFIAISVAILIFSDMIYGQNPNFNSNNRRNSRTNQNNRFGGAPMNFNSMPRRPGGMGKRKSAPLFEAQYATADATKAIIINNEAYYASDGTFMTGNFYKGTPGEETIPVILLHDEGGSKNDLDAMAKKLAKEGMAVLVPDLRGHGECTQRVVPDYSHGPRPINRFDSSYTYDTFTDQDRQAMINLDGLFWFNFLIGQHNQGHLNLRKLVILGSGLGGAVGLGWVKNDWAITSKKIGHFTKILAFVTPKYEQCKELALILKRKRSDELRFIGFVGASKKDELKDIQKLQGDLSGKQAAETPVEKKNFLLMELKTETQGIDLLKNESFGVASQLQKFIDMRMKDKKIEKLEWTEIEFDEDK